MSQTLLEMALSRQGKTGRKAKLVSNEEIELAFAWMKGLVGYQQLNFALRAGTGSNNVLYRMAIVLRDAYQKGRIKIVENK